MRNKLIAGGVAAVAVAALVATPVVSEAAGQITGKQIKNNSVTGKDIKNDTLTGQDVAESSLAQVSSAAKADTATSAATATSAGNAATLGSLPPSAFAASAQPGFTAATLQAGFSIYDASFSAPGFMKDTLGFVHLQGTMQCTSGTAFTLPAGMRPAVTMFLPIAVGSLGAGNLQVESDGDVITYIPGGSNAPCGLDGVTFRAASGGGGAKQSGGSAASINH